MSLLPQFGDMEIVHVVRQSYPGVGGLEEFVAKLTAEQRSVFGKVRVVTCDRIFTSPQNRLPKSETLDGVRIDRLPYWGSSKYPVMPGLLGAVKSADLIHVHAIDFAYDALAATRSLHRKPMLVTTHGGFFHTTAHANLKKLWFRTLTKQSARGYGAVVCCSESDQERFETIAADRVRLVMNGVDVEKYRDAGSQSPARHAVTLGRFSNNKRLDNLLTVFAALVVRQPEWKLDIFGVPYDVSQDDLKFMVEALGLQSNVTIQVGLPASEIRQALRRSTYFMSASEYEGFGLALVEAMSAGLMPVVQPNGAYTAFADKHKNVTLCDFSNPLKAAEQIGRLHETVESNFASLRQAVIDTVQEYSWTNVAREYHEIYGDILAYPEYKVHRSGNQRSVASDLPFGA